MSFIATWNVCFWEKSVCAGESENFGCERNSDFSARVGLFSKDKRAEPQKLQKSSKLFNTYFNLMILTSSIFFIAGDKKMLVNIIAISFFGF